MLRTTFIIFVVVFLVEMALKLSESIKHLWLCPAECQVIWSQCSLTFDLSMYLCLSAVPPAAALLPVIYALIPGFQTWQNLRRLSKIKNTPNKGCSVLRHSALSQYSEHHGQLRWTLGQSDNSGTWPSTTKDNTVGAILDRKLVAKVTFYVYL